MLKWYLKDAPVTRKIQIGVGLLAITTAAASGFAAMQIKSAEQLGQDYRTNARTNLHLSNAEVALMRVRIEARDFLEGAEERNAQLMAESRDALREHHRNAEEALREAREGAPTEALRQRIAKTEADLDAYVEAALDPTAEARRNELAKAMVEHIVAVSDELDAAQNTLGPQMSEELHAVSLFAMSLAALVLLFGGAVAMGMGAIIATPLRKATDDLERLAAGDLTVDVTGLDRQDDTGRLNRALQVFKENSLQIQRMRQEQQEAEIRAEQERRQTLEQLAAEFERSVLSVVDAVAGASTELEASAGALTRTAGEADMRADKVARIADVSATNVQTVASAAEEMAASAEEIAAQVNQANTVARQAEVSARDADTTVRDLAIAAQRIGEVVNLISDIASQTNLLALNATIEAARAGDAGRGFAVVAAEVKRLAEQTAKATDDIAQQISGIQGVTEGAVTALRAISGTIGEICTISTSISAAVEEQTAAVREISRNTAEVADGTREVTTAISAVRQGSSETGSAAEQSLAAAKELGRQASSLRDQVRGFIAQVRAA